MIYIWLAIFIIALIIEDISYQLVSIWFAPAAIISLVASCLGAPLWLQITIFIVSSALFVLLTRPLAIRFLKHKSPYAEKQISRTDSTGTVTERITNSSGRVLLKGTYWAAKSVDATEIPEGALVVVENQVGTTLIVKLLTVKENS